MGTTAVLVRLMQYLQQQSSNLQWCSSGAFTETTDICKAFCGKSQLSDLPSSLERKLLCIADDDIMLIYACHCVEATWEVTTRISEFYLIHSIKLTESYYILRGQTFRHYKWEFNTYFNHSYSVRIAESLKRLLLLLRSDDHFWQVVIIPYTVAYQLPFLQKVKDPYLLTPF